MPATKRGIFHNLKESKYVVSNSEITFFFSSEKYLNKFIESVEEHRETFSKRMQRVTGEIPLNVNILADITLYENIEKRGFRAWVKGVDISCQELYRYALRKMTEQNTLDWCVIQKPKLKERIRIME